MKETELTRTLEKSQESPGTVCPRREKRLVKSVVAYPENFLENIDSLKAYKICVDNGAALLDSANFESGIGIDERYRL